MVQRLTKNVTVAHLEEIFEVYGKVTDVDLPIIKRREQLFNAGKIGPRADSMGGPQRSRHSQGHGVHHFLDDCCGCQGVLSHGPGPARWLGHLGHARVAHPFTIAPAPACTCASRRQSQPEPLPLTRTQSPPFTVARAWGWTIASSFNVALA